MGIFSRIFGKGKGESKNQVPKHEITNEEYKKILELECLINSLLDSTHYVARSEYITELDKYKSTIEYFSVLKDSQMLRDFCTRNQTSELTIVKVLSQYKDIYTLIDEANERYIHTQMDKEKAYLDNILIDVNSDIVLDNDQRKIILTDEDYCLVIAGAGAGKTTTIAAKVKYLVDKKGINPNQILIVSFTNKAVKELKEKIQDLLRIDCPIATFHSTGNAIIHKNSPNEKLNIVDKSKLYFVIKDYFAKTILKNETMVNKIIMFFASYIDVPYEGNDFNRC